MKKLEKIYPVILLHIMGYLSADFFLRYCSDFTLVEEFVSGFFPMIKSKRKWYTINLD